MTKRRFWTLRTTSSKIPIQIHRSAVEAAVRHVVAAYHMNFDEKLLDGARLTSMKRKFPVVGIDLANIALAFALNHLREKTGIAHVGLSHDDSEKRKGTALQGVQHAVCILMSRNTYCIMILDINLVLRKRYSPLRFGNSRILDKVPESLRRSKLPNLSG